MSDTQVEAKEVGLGEQPNFKNPPTHEELKAAKEANAPIVASHWKQIHDLMQSIQQSIQNGSDPETMQLRSYVSVQAHHAGIKVSQGK